MTQMKEIMEFTKQAGDDSLQSLEDPSLQLFGEVIPEWVRLPQQLGGEKRTVQSYKKINCVCGGEHIVLELNLGDNFYVSECPSKGFLWYRK